MINAKELRIGNYVWFTDVPEKKDRHATVNAISEDCISTDKGMAIDEELKSIPLTEKWLNDFGFEDICNHDYLLIKDKSFMVVLNYQDESLYDVVMNNYEINKIKHVHQLQNLYFALTGKELTKQK